MAIYDPSIIETKWQKRWGEAKVYDVDLAKAKKPYYTHVMFPYPSGDKLHVGHWYNYGGADTFARFKRMCGYDVFSPIGFDAFGLPAENYAVKTGIHPATSITNNVETMIRQLKRIGCMYDWGKSVNTSTPEYYRWTQWLFLQMFKNDLAERRDGNVNFCPKCQTVLANEQVWDGKCERCETEVIQKPLTQWYWKITKYADRLLQGLESLDWPEKTKMMQRNWIGKKEGINITYEIDGALRGVVGCDGCFGGLKPAETQKNGGRNPALKGGVNETNQTQAGHVVNGCVANAGHAVNGCVANAGHDAEGCVNRGLQAAVTAVFPSPPSGLQPTRRVVHLVIELKDRETIFTSQTTTTSLLRILDNVGGRHAIVLHEACVMPDHVHLLVSFDYGRHMEKDIMQKLKGATAREFNKQQQRKGELWGRGGHFEDVRSPEQFMAALTYIQHNPAKANIDPAGRILSQLPITITCFTTRPDTNFGATFVVLAPEHPFVQKIITGKIGSNHRDDVARYVQASLRKTERNRQEEGTKKTGAFTGYSATNELTGAKMPIWVSDFVLAGFGTGAVVGVPGHDMRDFEFATTFGIPVIRVVKGPDGDTSDIIRPEQVQEEEGTMINSGFLDGLPIKEATGKIMDHMETMGMGTRVTTYRLRDWSISRQRYWGAPIPIVYDPEGAPHPIPEEHLPWLLPTDVDFTPTGTAPLAKSKELKERVEKLFGKGWTPEIDTMDTFVDSSFYSLMFLMPEHRTLAGGFNRRIGRAQDQFIDPMREAKWMPVQMYIGGAEHACMHLIYARFVGMALQDLGFITHGEQYQCLIHQGVITNKGAKMSKSKNNVVSPDSFVEKYGSDVFRMYLMFMGPFTEGGDWSDSGIRGIDRFVKRVHAFFTHLPNLQTSKPLNSLVPLLHRTIKKVTEDIEKLHFNTAISTLMEFLNEVEKAGSVEKETAVTFTKLLSPLAPHLAEELWESLKQKGFVIDAEWPKYDASKIISETFTLVIQINGKVRANVELPVGTSKENAIMKAKENENVKKYIDSKSIKKEIYVDGKLVSLVVS